MFRFMQGHDTLNRRCEVSSKPSSNEVVRPAEDWTSMQNGHHRRDLCGGTSGGECWGSVVAKTVLCVGCGAAFGIALHKANVMDPTVIRRQMLMEQFTMVKFFMSALATSMLSLSTMAILPFTRDAFKAASKEYYAKAASLSVLSSVVGGSIMGLGMTVSGSCSSSIFPQLGALVPNAQYTFAGALTAVLLYSLIKPTLDEAFKPKSSTASQPWSETKYFLVAVPLAGVLGLSAWGLENWVSSGSEIKLLSKAGASVLSRNVWPPYFAGMLVGGLQLPLVLGLQRTLGGSTSVSCLVAQLFVGPLRNKSQYLEKLRWGFSGTWQLYYALGAVFGGYISASAAGTLGSSPGVSVPASFVGGFLLYLGTRIGGGCTSGHGLSGNALLSPPSFIMIGSTFASAMASAFIFNHYKLI